MPQTDAARAVSSRALRVAAGHWLKGLRETRGLTQRALAERVGLRYYTFVSQIEGGHGKIPSEQYAAWADALGVDYHEFAKQLISFYDPLLHRMLFGGASIETLALASDQSADMPADRGTPAGA